jgi:hypothetical protein
MILNIFRKGTAHMQHTLPSEIHGMNSWHSFRTDRCFVIQCTAPGALVRPLMWCTEDFFP